MVRRGKLDVPVIGVARSDWTLEQLQAARTRQSREARRRRRGRRSRSSAALLRYVDGDYRDPATFQALREALGKRAAARCTTWRSRPACSRPWSSGLGAVGARTSGARVVVEKPFGRDLASAQRAEPHPARASSPKTRIFRIDHYLGKEPVQNLLYFRFANTFLEPIWNRNYVEQRADHHGREFGVAGPRRVLRRDVGAIRDVVQNHLLQVLCAAGDGAAGRAPTAEALRDEKVKVLKAMRPLEPPSIVRGQFVGYRDEPGVAPDSDVETFAALRLHIDSWRWAGRAVLHPRRQGARRHRDGGARRAATAAAPAVRRSPQPPEPNIIRFRLGSPTSRSPWVQAKPPGEHLDSARVDLDVDSRQRSAARARRVPAPARRRDRGDRGCSRARTSSRRPGAWSSRCSTKPRPQCPRARLLGTRRGHRVLSRQHSWRPPRTAPAAT